MFWHYTRDLWRRDDVYSDHPGSDTVAW
jgi:hypothetical protein